MSDDGMKRVGIVFKSDGSVNFQKTLKEVNQTVNENRSAFALAKSEWNESTSSMEKLRAQQEYLQSQTEAYSDKVAQLTDILEQLESAENRDEVQISKTKQQINNAQAALNNYERGLNDVNNQLENGTAQLEDYAKKVGEVGDKVTKAGASMTKGVTLPIAGIAAAAVKTTASFESSMSQVQATMGITSDAVSDVNGATVNTMDTLNDLAREMGGKTAFSASECAEALNYLALAGYDTQQMTDTLPTVLNLAAAGNIDLASASDMVTDAMSALGMEVSESEIMVDQMAKTASSTNTSVAQLGEGILTIGATARSVKGGTAELNTALGILANNGIKASEGGTHLRNVILSLQNPKEKATYAMEDLGISVYDLEGNMRSLNDILGDLNAGMSEMTAEERDNIISKIFNKTDLAAVNALLANTGSTWDELQQAITDSGGAAEQMAETQLDNLSGQLTILKSSTEELAISLGEMLLPYIKNIVEGIKWVVDKVNSLDEGTKKVIATVAIIIAVLGPTLIVIGKISTGISAMITLYTKLVPALSVVKSGIAGVNSVLAANPAILVIASIIAIIASFVHLYNKCEWFREGVDKLWAKIKEVFTEDIPKAFNFVVDWVKDNWQGLLLFIVNPFAGAFKLIYDNCDEFREKVDSIIDKVKEKWESITDAIDSVVEAVREGWKDVKEAVKLPHFDISGGFSISPPKTPKLSVDWYANGGILNSPTIFGMNGSKMLGGGEAGEEAVLPISNLLDYMRTVNMESNSELLDILANKLPPALATVLKEAPIEVVVYLGDKQLSKEMTAEVVKNLNMQNANYKAVRGVGY